MITLFPLFRVLYDLCSRKSVIVDFFRERSYALNSWSRLMLLYLYDVLSNEHYWKGCILFFLCVLPRVHVPSFQLLLISICGFDIFIRYGPLVILCVINIFVYGKMLYVGINLIPLTKTRVAINTHSRMVRGYYHARWTTYPGKNLSLHTHGIMYARITQKNKLK